MMSPDESSTAVSTFGEFPVLHPESAKLWEHSE